MEQNNDVSLFDMNMDASTQTHLLSVSKWTKFISITGFVTGALFLILLAAFGQQIITSFSGLFSVGETDLAGALIAVVIIALVLVGCWLFFLFKSSRLLKAGLENRNSAMLADGFKAMRVYFIFSFIMSLLGILSTFSTLL